ncbi:MAG: SpoIIE family protein phosphatase [Eubacterium sp.]|nr:SpoIIE family protein phosphatase [Eubacterium sp.]
MDKKRIPIRRRFLRIDLSIVIISIVVSGVLSVLSMMNIRNTGEKALLNEGSKKLVNLVADKALLANSQLEHYKNMVRDFASYIHKYYKNPENYVPRAFPEYDVNDPDIAGKYTLQYALAHEVDKNSAKWQEIKEEMMLCGNLVDQMDTAITAEDSDILTTYWTFESGFMISYDNVPELGPEDHIYDFSDSEWFVRMRDKQEIFFTDVYLDSFGRGLTITCAAPFYDASDKYAGVVCIDILITDVYSSIVSMDIGQGGYAMLVDSTGNVISPEGEEKSVSQIGLNAEEIEKVESGSDAVFLSEQGDYIASAGVDSVGWTLLVKAPEKLIREPVDDMNSGILVSILIFVAVLIVLLLIVTIVVRRYSSSFTAPLLALREDVGTISEGNFDHRARIINNDEIGDLAISFNEMAHALDVHIKNVVRMTGEKERISAELNVAANIQAQMLPSDFNIEDKLSVYATMTPAREMGGDFYDYFRIDDDHIGIVMADVSGKGIPAAMLMIIAKTLIKIRTTAPGSPSQVLYDVNNTLCEDNPYNLFVTVWFAIMTVSTGEVISSNAGHEYPAISRSGGAYELIKTDNMPPLATMEGLEYVDERFRLGPGDKLFLYTDGVPEAKSSDGSRYTIERMIGLLNRDIALSPDEVIKDMKNDIDNYVGDTEPFDDITMMSISVSGHEQ